MYQGSPLDTTGPAVRLVEVVGFMEEFGLVICRDEFRKEYEVFGGIGRTSRSPQIGEWWFIDRAMGSWSFAGWLESTRQPDVAQAGKIELFASAALPASHLACNGSAVAKADYPRLYEAIGDSFGSPTANPARAFVAASQSFSLTGSALSGGALAATPSGYVGKTFTLSSTMSFANGDTDVLLIAVGTPGAKIRSVSPQWRLTDPAELMALRSGSGLGLFALVARRGVLTNSQPTFVIDFLANSRPVEQVAVVQRHKISNLPVGGLIPQSLPSEPSAIYASEHRSGNQTTEGMWLDTKTGYRTQTFSFVAFAHGKYTAGSPALTADAGMTLVTANSNVSALTSLGKTTGLSMSTYTSSAEDPEPVPERRRFSASPGWDSPADAADWAAFGLVSTVADGVRQTFLLPNVAAPTAATVYAISTGL